VKEKQHLALLATAVVLIAAACGGASSSTSSSGASSSGAPFSVKQPWGTFHLASRIADKVRSHQTINYVFSYQASGIALFSQQYQQGYQRGCEDGQKIYPLNCSAIAPVQNDANVQLSQIQAKLAAKQIDCISIEPTDSDAMTAITNQMMDQGIPVFTAGVTSRGHEFTNFTQTPMKEGQTAAQTLLNWMQQTHHNLKVFAVSGGDPSQFWAQGRMRYFRETIQKAVPDAKFVNTESNALTVPYDPGKAYDAAKAFLASHPTVEFLENVDIGAEHAGKAITNLGRVGKTFTIGWNVSSGQLDAIESGIQVAALDQRWPDQAAFGGPACATFLAKGKILPNTQTLRPILKPDVPAARAELAKTLGGGG